MVEISAVEILHDDAEALGLLVDEGLAITDDVGVIEGGEDTDLVEGVCFLALG